MSGTVAVTGKVALVTGANRGIGLAIARKLTEMGAKVSWCARDEKKLKEAAGGGLTVAADLKRPADIERAVKATEEKLGPIDILVNNAGIGYFGPTHEASEETWNEVMDTNLKAVFLLSKAVAPGMIARKGGQIINISSLAGKNAFAGGGIYCASKWGLMGLTASMAEDLRQYGIRVSVICPGSVATHFDVPGKKDASKMLQPEDVAHAVEMLVTQAPQSFISEVSLRPTQKP